MEAADIDSSSSSSESGSDTGLPRAAEAAIARKRSTNRSSKIPGKKTRVAGGPTTKAKRIGVSTRLQEFPKEPFSISQGSLYCDACHVVLQTKKSIIKNHVATERHATGKKQLEKSSIRQTAIAASWATYKKEHVAETWIWISSSRGGGGRMHQLIGSRPEPCRGPQSLFSSQRTQRIGLAVGTTGEAPTGGPPFKFSAPSVGAGGRPSTSRPAGMRVAYESVRYR